MMKITNSGSVSCVVELSVGAGRNGMSVKIAGAHEDCTTGGHYYTCHNPCSFAYYYILLAIFSGVLQKHTAAERRRLLVTLLVDIWR